MPMHFSKIKISLVFFVFLGLTSYGLSSLPTKAVYGYDYLVNHNNSYNVYSSPGTPHDKESALQNIDCVVNFMQSYVFTSFSVPSSYSSCSKDTITTTEDDPNWYQSNQGWYPPSIDNTQRDFHRDSGLGAVKVIDLNGSNNIDEHLASHSHPSYFTPAVTYKIGTQSENDNDNDEKKVYNENTVTKEERKILLKACFERAEDKGNYISSKEMKECAENYNS